ncbi:hypothetical protein QBC35DRAFT_465739 [Podospora australis]|uniref:Uncharacterized protein n=1 Tax=Podospora australis TaxID=1536484 RepID=A0AAN6WNR0_9PEZI|nr:hypothetical protein QBC35DRAFT_465739 [Podospora australis]
MDDSQSVESIQRPLIAYIAHRDSTLPESYDHWNLPEVYDPRDLPEVYIPVVINNRHAIVTYSPNKTLASLQDTPNSSVSSVKLARSCWRRNWIAISLLAIVIVAGVIGGSVAGTLVPRRREAESLGRQEGLASTTAQPPTAPTQSNAPSASTSQALSTTTSTTGNTSRQTSGTITSRSQTSATTGPQVTDTAKPRAVVMGSAERLNAPVEILAIAFLEGQACNYTPIGKHGDWVCDTPFVLGGKTYQWKGCGGSTWATVNDPTPKWFGQCSAETGSLSNCGDVVVTGNWKCSPDNEEKGA